MPAVRWGGGWGGLPIHACMVGKTSLVLPPHSHPGGAPWDGGMKGEGVVAGGEGAAHAVAQRATRAEHPDPLEVEDAVAEGETQGAVVHTLCLAGGERHREIFARVGRVGRGRCCVDLHEGGMRAPRVTAAPCSCRAC